LSDFIPASSSASASVRRHHILGYGIDAEPTPGVRPAGERLDRMEQMPRA
jgi:hypothetical protein